MTPDQIAEVVHEANRALQLIQDDPAPSQHWPDAPGWQRESAVDGVKNALAGATSEESHENWCRFREADGWVHGETKSESARTHPALIPYEELSAELKLRDDLFIAIVGALRS